MTSSGGLAGYSRGVIAASYATARVAGDLAVGGLAGVNSGAVVASYATGSVEGRSGVGGVVGLLYGGRVDASYATGRVSGAGNVGGLVGSIASTGGDVTAGYWDTRTSGLAGGEPGQGRGQSTAALQGPGGYTGLYRTWEVDLDGDRRRESPWHFGTGTQYPALALDVDGNGQATWQEMGHQLREGPTLTVSARAGRGGAGLDPGGCEPLDPGAGRPLHGAPRRRRRRRGTRRGRRRSGVHRLPPSPPGPPTRIRCRRR